MGVRGGFPLFLFLVTVLSVFFAHQREALLNGVQQRNALLDSVFYDVRCIMEAEKPSLAFWRAKEGALLIVPPSGGDALEVFAEKESLFDQGGGDVKALAVAGVGSSALGAAAFARNLADALGGSVAAIVSGYGLSDVLTEAMGGFFLFGALNSVRHRLEGLDRPSMPLGSGGTSSLMRLSKDTATLIDLLSDARFEIPLLVGHSKGNLVISEALYALEARQALAPVAERCRIVTISAKIGMPSAFRGKVIDVMGQWDGFGALNSRPDIPADLIVPGAWHSTNPHFPFGMGLRVTPTLKDALTLFDMPRTPQKRPIFADFMEARKRTLSALTVPA